MTMSLLCEFPVRRVPGSSLGELCTKLGLGIYEQGGHASREDDAIILENVLDAIREDAEATDRQELHDLVANRPRTVIRS